MPFKTIKVPISTDPSPQEWRPTNLAGGVVWTDLPQNILDSQSPGMLNLWYKEKVLTKRYGQEYYSVGATGAILAMYDKLYNGCMVFTSSTKMYSINKSTGIKTEIYSSLTASKGSFFTFKNKTTGVSILYYINGHEYVQYDGTTVSTVQSHAYIPTVLMGRAPTGGGTVLEQYNAIGAGFTTSFSPNGTATVYTLPQSGLDATLLTCTSLGVVKVEGTDFTVDRVTGLVTFTTVPVTGTDTLKITAYKTDSTQLGYILGCKYAITFGGNNDTRVFIAGDSTTYYYSGLLDPTYFPENQYNNAGVDNTYITGFGVQYNTLVVFKERSLGVVTYQVNTDGSNPSFPYSRMSSAIGCDMPYTIQLISNHLVWCNTYGGVHTLVSDTNIKDEKDVRPISYNIDGTIERPGLLGNTKSDMQNATSIDFYGMYWLCVGSKVYVWDYDVSPYTISTSSSTTYQTPQNLSWFPFDNINANCWLGIDQDLYYGDRTGNIVHFLNSNVNVQLDYADFGLPINAYFQTKVLDMGLFDWLKYILDVRYKSKSDVFTNTTVTYLYDGGERVDSKHDTVGTFAWNHFSWATFTWQIVSFAKTFHKQPKIRNTIYFSVKFSNNLIYNNLSILDIAILWIPTKRTN